MTIESVTAPSFDVSHAAQQRARRDTGRCDEHVVARDKVVGREHAVEVVACLDECRPLFSGARPELSLDPTADAFQRRPRR